jgi:hypothetical protein
MMNNDIETNNEIGINSTTVEKPSSTGSKFHNVRHTLYIPYNRMPSCRFVPERDRIETPLVDKTMS